MQISKNECCHPSFWHQDHNQPWEMADIQAGCRGWGGGGSSKILVKLITAFGIDCQHFFFLIIICEYLLFHQVPQRSLNLCNKMDASKPFIILGNVDRNNYVCVHIQHYLRFGGEYSILIEYMHIHTFFIAYLDYHLSLKTHAFVIKYFIYPFFFIVLFQLSQHVKKVCRLDVVEKQLCQKPGCCLLVRLLQYRTNLSGRDTNKCPLTSVIYKAQRCYISKVKLVAQLYKSKHYTSFYLQAKEVVNF